LWNLEVEQDHAFSVVLRWMALSRASGALASVFNAGKVV
jgi:hypothetical protein